MRQTAAAGYVSSDDYTGFLGHVGIAVTLLRPSGTAEIEGVRLPVVSEGEFVSAGTAVQVVARPGQPHRRPRDGATYPGLAGWPPLPRREGTDEILGLRRLTRPAQRQEPKDGRFPSLRGRGGRAPGEDGVGTPPTLGYNAPMPRKRADAEYANAPEAEVKAPKARSRSPRRQAPRKPEFSPTRLRTFLACPMMYRLEYVEKVGKFYHKARAGLHLRQHAAPDPADLPRGGRQRRRVGARAGRQAGDGLAVAGLQDAEHEQAHKEAAAQILADLPRRVRSARRRRPGRS